MRQEKNKEVIQMVRLKIIALISCAFLATILFSKEIDFCEFISDLYVYKSGTSQDKYLSAKLDKIVKGTNQEKQEAIKKLVSLIKKKRVRGCAIKFLESLNTYINDYIQTLGNSQEADEATATINKWISNKVSCLIIRNELNLRLKVKIPYMVCEIEDCHMLPLELSSAFGGGGGGEKGESKELLLTTFLELFWKDYYTSNKILKEKIKNTWTDKICGGINDIKKSMLEEYKVTDSNMLIDDEDFKRNVSEYILRYFGIELIPTCGKSCAFKIMDIASKRTLECGLRVQLLELVSRAFRRTSKNVDLDSQIQLFITFDKLARDRCYYIQFALSDTLFDMELYRNKKIMEIVIKKILSHTGGYSEEEIFLKNHIVSGFINISHRIYDIEGLEELLQFFEKEFERTKDSEYKDLLLRTLFAFNRYTYIIKNEKKLFQEYVAKLPEEYIKLKNSLLNIEYMTSIYLDPYLNTLLQISALYGLESFKKYFEQNIPSIIKKLEESGREEDKMYFIIILGLFGYTDKVTEGYAMSLLNGVAPPLLKQYAFKNLLYNVSRRELINNYLNKLYENPDVGCLSYLASAAMEDITAFKKVENLENCDKMNISTEAGRELVKLSLDKNWQNTIKGNQTAINILNLNLARTNEFVGYETCNVGHKPIGAPPTFVKNVVYGLECNKICEQRMCYCKSCNKLSLGSALIYLNLNNLNSPSFFKRLNENTGNIIYRGRLKDILRKIGRELNATVDFGALKKGPYKYLLNFFGAFPMSYDKQLNKSTSSYKTLFLKISDRFLITFIFYQNKKSNHNFIKVIPFESASNIWNIKLNRLFND